MKGKRINQGSDLRAGLVKGYAVNSFSPAPRKPNMDVITLCPRCKEASTGRGVPTDDPGIMLSYCLGCEIELERIDEHRRQCQAIFDKQRNKTRAILTQLRAQYA